MYEHHKESLRIMAEHYRRQPGVIALIFGGSVAKGIERPDSDLDGMAVVSQEEFDRSGDQHKHRDDHRPVHLPRRLF